MKHILTISLCFLTLSFSAQETITYPYNPDFDNDQHIGLSDLLDFLSAFGNEFEIQGFVMGCTYLYAVEYNPLATMDDGSCTFTPDCAGVINGDSVEDECGVCGGDNTSCVGCMDSTAINFAPLAMTDDGTCNKVNNLLIWRNSNDIFNINMKWNVVNNDNDCSQLSCVYDFGYQSRTRGQDNTWSSWSTAVKFVNDDYPTSSTNYVSIAMQGVHETIEDVVCLAYAYDIRLVVFAKDTLLQLDELESEAAETINLSQTGGSNQYNCNWYRDFGIYTSRGLPYWTNGSWDIAHSSSQGPQAPGMIPGYPYTESGQGMLIPGYSTYIESENSWYFMFYVNGSWSISTGVVGGWSFVPGNTSPGSQHMQGALQSSVASGSWATYSRTYLVGLRNPPLSLVTPPDTIPLPSPLGDGVEGVPGMPTTNSIGDYIDNITWAGTSDATENPLTITITDPLQ